MIVNMQQARDSFHDTQRLRHHHQPPANGRAHTNVPYNIDLNTVLLLYDYYFMFYTLFGENFQPLIMHELGLLG